MNLKKSRLNNLKMGFQRNSVEYEAIMLDLYLVGILSKEAFESLTGRECPSYVNLPNGMKPIYCRPDEVDDVKKPEEKKPEEKEVNGTTDNSSDEAEERVLEDEEVEKLLEDEEEVNGTTDNSSNEGDSSTTDID